MIELPHQVEESLNGMKVGDVVRHLPAGLNWYFKDDETGKWLNPRSGRRRVRILELYAHGDCAVVRPIKGKSAACGYICDIADLEPLRKPAEIKREKDKVDAFYEEYRVLCQKYGVVSVGEIGAINTVKGTAHTYMIEIALADDSGC